VIAETRILQGVEEIRAAAARESGASDFLREVLAIWPTIEAAYSPTGERYDPARMCLDACRLAVRAFNDDSVTILEGDVVLAPRESIEHYVVLRRHKDCFVVVDFTASQLPWFREDPVVAVAQPSGADLRETLEIEWRWWTPPAR
jgi:hypothetical protein